MAIYFLGVGAGLILGFLLGEINAMRRQRKHEESRQRFRRTGTW